jgi:protein involved in polysaccharide export with SLBB domain
MKFASLSLAAFLAAGCASAPPDLGPRPASTSFSSQLDWSAFPLGPNDVVKVGIYGQPDLGTVGTRVDMEGNLSLPLVGAVKVAGLSTREAREAIAAAHTRFVVDPRVDLSVVTHGARRVYVYGEVTRPGALDLDRPINVTQALALAGGFTPKADRDEVVLLRGVQSELEWEIIDSEEPNGRGFIALKADDVIFVRRSNAGKFSDEVLPYLSGISASLSTVATILLIDDRLGN